jgi:hypothetical protein
MCFLPKIASPSIFQPLPVNPDLQKFIFFFLNYYNTMQQLVTLKSIGSCLWIWASCILHPFSLIYFFSKKDCQSSRNNVLFAMTQKTMPEDEQQYTSGMTQKTTQKTRNNVLYLLSPQVFPLPHVFPSSVKEPTKPQDTQYS